MPAILAEIADALAVHGLIPRGGFAFGAEEAAPPGPHGEPARAVLLVGNAGAEYWQGFQEWRAWHPADIADPLDIWSREVIGAVAGSFVARAVSPSDRPYLPFQQWAMRAEGLRPSPLGILMHPEYGLWHAYRGALLFGDGDVVGELDSARLSAHTPIHLCDLCHEKPCLNACPVGAYSSGGFAYQDCLSHVRGPAGGACRESGCLDRNACPYGAAYRYPASVQAFHMEAYTR